MTFLRSIASIAFTFLLGSWAMAQPYSQAQIFGPQAALAKLGIAVDHVHNHGDYVAGDFSAYEIETARQAGYQVKVIIPDVEQAFKHRKQDHRRSTQMCVDELFRLNYETPANFVTTGYSGQFTYEQMEAELDKMALLYPHLISKRQPIGDFITYEGRPIQWLRISDNPEQEEVHEPQMLYTALHHAREPISLTQLIYYMWYLLENYDVNEEIKYLVDHVELYFVPCVNPDGYVYNQKINPEGGGRWRKNRRDNGDGTFGVDLNRNYGHQWGHDNVGSSDRTQSEVYRGPASFSEPETQAIRDLVMQHDFKLALNYHSWGGFLIYPYGFTNGPAEDADIFRELANLLTQENRYIYGTGIETVEYTTNGDADDWMYGGLDDRRIFSMTPEIGTEEHGFWPDERDVEFLCKSSLKQNLLAAEFLLNSAIFSDGSESYLTETQGALPFKITKLGFEDVAFNVRFSPITSNITFTSPAKIYILNLFGAQQDNLEYLLDASIQDGERIKFSYTIDNGTYAVTDTVVKYYREPNFALNNSGSLINWDDQGLETNWAETDKLFVSEPSSLTDSPNGNTIPYTTNHLTLDHPVSLSGGGDSVVLTFKAYWDIQNQFDYLVAEISADGGPYSPLCGQYSVPGRLMINDGLPIYTGRQLDWIIERIDLTEFIGKDISLRFTMRSTNSDTRDGAYLDDIRVLQYNQGSITAIDQIEPEHLESYVYPNPATTELFFEKADEQLLKDFSKIQFFNSLGVKIADLPIDQLHIINIESWGAGLYFYALAGKDGRRSVAKKLIID